MTLSEGQALAGAHIRAFEVGRERVTVRLPFVAYCCPVAPAAQSLPTVGG